MLDEALWVEAGIEHEARRISDPWEDLLRDMPEWVTLVVRQATAGYQEYKEKDAQIIHRDATSKEDRVSANDVLEHVLKIPPGNQTPAHTMRLSTVMRKLGWERPSNGNLAVGGKDRVKGYFKRHE